MAIKFDDTGEVIGSPSSRGRVVFDDQKNDRKIPLSMYAKTAFEELPQVKAFRNAKENPQTMLPMAGAALGTAIAPGPGTAMGAGLGQIGSRMIDIKKGAKPMSPAMESIGPMIQTFMGGIPEVSGVFKPGTMTLADRTSKAFSRMGETMSGAKQDVLEQAHRQGPSTYGAPSMKKAKDIFSEALGPEGRTATKQTAAEAFDPALSQARATARDIGTKLENGKPITAIEALRARQATDRVISATPFWDGKTKQALFDWRSKFDDVMASQSGKLKNASDIYRKSIVRDTLLEPLRITKSGRQSSFLPMLLGAMGPVAGFETGHTGKGTMAALGGLAATSPAVWGLGATASGMISPSARQAIIAGVIQKLIQQQAQQ